MRRLLVPFAAVALLVSLAAPAGATTAGHLTAARASAWQIKPSANQSARQVRWTGVACTSATWCMAVGYALDRGDAPKPVSAVWRGRSWAAKPIPNPNGSGYLFSLSCTSPHSCIALGQTNKPATHPYVDSDRWNGKRWHRLAVPSTFGGRWVELNGITCRTATWCVAVGETPFDGSNPAVPIDARFNGSRWTFTAISSAPSGTTRLNAVACRSTSDCLAIGTRSQSPSTLLAEHWDGQLWMASTPPGGGNVDRPGALSGVACVPKRCLAVGNQFHSVGGVPLVDSWNGTSWRRLAVSAKSSKDESLGAVSCHGSNSCMAVGGTQTGPFAMRWNGHALTASHPPFPRGWAGGLQSVSCPSVKTCIAVGVMLKGSIAQLAVADHWNSGKWSRKTVPNPVGSLATQLAGISCTAKGFCAAVGYSDYSGVNAVFAETNHGAGWSGRRLAKPHEASAALSNTGVPGLSSVSCTSATFCAAVGTWEDKQGVIHSMSQTWNGKAWRLRPTAGDSAGVLVAVSCRSRTMCMAVGSFSDVNGIHPLAEKWDGTRWQVLTAVATYDGAALLTAVDCVAPSRCVAAGIQSPPSSNEQALAEQWTGGAKWKLLQQPPAPSGATVVALTGVSCSSTNNCMAVGDWFDGSNVEHMVAERLSSGKWSDRALPDPAGSLSSALAGVSCTSSACTAVGAVATGQQRAHPVIEHWSGSTWKAVTAAVAARNQSSDLAAVTCHSTCLAAGAQRLTTNGEIGLIERN